MINQLIDADYDIDPNVNDKYIGTTVILDNTFNGGGNNATVKIQ